MARANMARTMPRGGGGGAMPVVVSLHAIILSKCARRSGFSPRGMARVRLNELRTCRGGAARNNRQWHRGSDVYGQAM